jgi:hypothetical protein
MDLTDVQWAVLEPTFRPRRRPDGRGRRGPIRALHLRGETVKRVQLDIYYVYSNTTLTVLLRTEYGTP